jgi:cell wall-associated NlpC family hydrolase
VMGDDFWMWNGSALVRLNRSKPAATAYLPWNDPQMLPNAFLADSAGVWIASNVGVRRIEFIGSEKPIGYGGFISIPLGPETERTDDKVADKIVRELYKWRFAPVAMAGTDGAKMVSEVYKSAGISLPNSTPGILNSPAGTVVYDELKIGDVVSSSRGLAIYIGNGKTVEVKDGVVKNGTVWDRPFAVVRRFSK